MTYTITGHSAAGTVSVERRTAVEAINKAIEMVGAGMASVSITDVATGRVYRPDDFPLLLLSERRARIPPETEG
jgi:hypothetical protein